MKLKRMLGTGCILHNSDLIYALHLQNSCTTTPPKKLYVPPKKKSHDYLAILYLLSTLGFLKISFGKNCIHKLEKLWYLSTSMLSRFVLVT